jgi:general secretion pathway protein M
MPDVSEQNKYALVTGAALLLLCLIAAYVFVPAEKRKKNLRRSILATKANLDEMITIQQNHTNSSQNIDDKSNLLKKRHKGFSLFGYFDATAKRCGVKKNVAYIKPSFQNIKDSKYKKAFVKARLESISLKECVAFFNKIENNKNIVSINSFSISTTGKNHDMIDVIIETETMVLIN